jgi:hypothetical protein
MKLSIKRLRSVIHEALIRENDESKPVNPEQAKEVLKKFPKGAKKLGIHDVDSLQTLGTGTQGTAFLAGDKVLKITKDAKEAHAASVLVGQHYKNIVNFYGVWSLGDTGLYAVLQEKLLPLPSDEAKAFDNALVQTGVPVWIKRAGGDWDKVKQLTKDHVSSVVKEKFKTFDSPEAKEFVKKANESWNSLTRKYGIKDMFDTLNKAGIHFADYHAGNMMKREDGTLVLIDLGLSNVKGTGNIQTITQGVEQMR